jgi:hypothetical protein
VENFDKVLAGAVFFLACTENQFADGQSSSHSSWPLLAFGVALWRSQFSPNNLARCQPVPGFLAL